MIMHARYFLTSMSWVEIPPGNEERRCLHSHKAFHLDLYFHCTSIVLIVLNISRKTSLSYILEKKEVFAF